MDAYAALLHNRIKYLIVSCPSKEDPYTTFEVLLCQTSIGEDADLHESRTTRNSLRFGSPTITEDLTSVYEGMEPIAQ
jgi:hypothetical protein